MLARQIGMFSKLVKKKSPNRLQYLARFPYAGLHIELLKDIQVGTSKKLDNNPQDIKYKNFAHYQSESLNEFKSCLVPNRLHIFVCPGSLKDGYILAGHVASFLTDGAGIIINDSVMSLQDGDHYTDANGNFVKIKSNFEGSIQYEIFVKKVKFIRTMEEELLSHLLSPSSNTYHRSNYLFSVPITELRINEILDNVERTVRSYKGKKFILYDAFINDEFLKALNCCFGFYRAMGVKGKRNDPSPQIVVWSYLKEHYKRFYENKSLRDKLLEKSNLKEHSQFKQDDDLEWDSPKP